MQKYHDEPKQYKGYLKSALASSGVRCNRGQRPAGNLQRS